MPEDYHNKLDYSKFRPLGYPVRHKRKIPFQPMLSLPLSYREMLHEIRKLDMMLDGFVLGSEDYLELVKDAFSDNIHWSTKIEGNQLSLEEVKRLTTRFTRGENIEVNNGPTQEILNHLYSFFAKKEMSLPWNTDTVKNVHALLMENVNKDVIPGIFRSEQASVVGSNEVEYFIACPPQSIEVEMESLIEWLNNSPYDEIVTATIFFHEFESIHPFKDGNGRTGRTLFQTLMQELGLKNCRLCKFEKEMLSDSGTYYDLLAFTDSTGSYSQIVVYFTESLLRAYRNAVSTFKEKDRLCDMDENTRAIVHKIKEVESFSFNEACAWIPRIGSQTVRSKLDRLIELDILEKHGKTKSMRYSFKDPLRAIKLE